MGKEEGGQQQELSVLKKSHNTLNSSLSLSGEISNSKLFGTLAVGQTNRLLDNLNPPPFWIPPFALADPRVHKNGRLE